MEEVKIEDKQKYLNDNYPFRPTPKFSDKKRCLHCDTIFTVEDYKVFKDERGEELIYCPHAPNCDGTVIDWFTVD